MFFIVDAKLAYLVFLERDWIHSSQCVPSMLHQQLMFYERDQVSSISAYECQFSANVRIAEALFYSPYLSPIQVFGN